MSRILSREEVAEIRALAESPDDWPSNLDFIELTSSHEALRSENECLRERLEFDYWAWLRKQVIPGHKDTYESLVSEIERLKAEQLKEIEASLESYQVKDALIKSSQELLGKYEELKAENERLKHPAGNKCSPEELTKHGLWGTKVCALCFKIIQQENERLRGALERVAAVSSDTSNIDFEAELARQALDGGHKCPHTETYTRANDSVHCRSCHAYLPERYGSQALQPEEK